MTLFDPPQTPPPEKQLVLFLDECVPRAIGARLIEFLGDRPEQPQARHALEFFKQGSGDDRDWARIVKENGWFPITADRGMSNKGEKLPRILKELGIVHVSFSGAVNRLPVRDKVLALAACWLDIVDVWRRQVGCAHRLCLTADGKGFRLVDVEARRRRPPEEGGTKGP
ncbi:MAG TPA: hypothetical protein VH370_05680 [Humisphaera sp.]|nr:hypothetical protein [Humisphaera sp.]